MRKFLSGVFVVVLLLVGLSFSYSDNANAAPKKGSIVTIKGKKYIYAGKYDYYLNLSYK